MIMLLSSILGVMAGVCGSFVVVWVLFKLAPRCPKCGYSFAFGLGPMKEHVSGAEGGHIKCECLHCNYTWEEPCKDAKRETKA